MLKSTLSALLLLTSSSVFANDAIIFTGQVKAGDNQSFFSPKTDNWRVQVQWMLPEGDIAKEGDIVVVFDGSSIENTIEQTTNSLLAAEEELFRLQGKAEQDLLEAQFNHKRSQLSLEKARIDASVSKEHLSEYDYQQNQLNYEKALVEAAKSKEQLAQTKITNKVSLSKQKLSIGQLKQTLTYNRSKLSKMGLRAKRSGPVIYANHPWNGEKVFVGMTAQPSWLIAEIPSLNGLYMEAWVHEVDYQHLKLNANATLTLDAYLKQPMQTTLTEISTQPEARKEWGNDVYYRTKFAFSNPNELKILPGMSGQISFENPKGQSK
ncbi:MAG: HlyD family secretion protein [Psychrobium sp.]